MENKSRPKRSPLGLKATIVDDVHRPLLLVAAQLREPRVLIPIHPRHRVSEAEQKGAAILELQRKSFAETGAKETPCVLDCIQVWRVLGVLRDQLDAAFLEGRATKKRYRMHTKKKTQ